MGVGGKGGGGGVGGGGAGEQFLTALITNAVEAQVTSTE